MTGQFAKLLREGSEHLAADRLSEARDTFRNVVRQSSEAGDRLSLAAAFCGLAEAESRLENLPTAEHIYSNAAALYRKIENWSKLAKVLRQQATLLRTLGHTIEAYAIEQEAQSLDRQYGTTNRAE